MKNESRKKTIIIQLLKTLFFDIVFGTFAIAVIIYYFFNFFFSSINLTFYSSLFYSLCISIIIEWIYTRKQIENIKLDLDIVDLHNRLKYNDINEIIKNRIELIELDIDNIKTETKKNHTQNFFKIPLELNIKEFKKFEILEILRKILPIDEKEFIHIDINGMIDFLSKSHSFIKFIKDDNSSKNKKLMKDNSNDNWLGMSLASNDEVKQTTLNYIDSIRHKFISIIIQEYTNQSSFSPVTSEYYKKLIRYDYYCSIKDKLDFNNDIFEIIANEMECLYSDSDKNIVLIHQLHKLFSYSSTEELLLLRKFQNKITENYLYLLSKKRTKSNYFLDRLYNEALTSNSVDLELLYKVRKDFSKYLFKKTISS